MAPSIYSVNALIYDFLLFCDYKKTCNLSTREPVNLDNLNCVLCPWSLIWLRTGYDLLLWEHEPSFALLSVSDPISHGWSPDGFGYYLALCALQKGTWARQAGTCLL